MTSRRIIVTLAVLWSALLWPTWLLACPVCAPGGTLSALETVQQAEQVVLAHIESDDRPRVSAVIKGTMRVNDRLDLFIRPAADDRAAADKRPVVLARDAQGGGWTLLGPLHPSRVSWLQAMSRLPGATRLSASGWADRVRWFLPQLEDQETLVAETAYLEIARAPYAAMRANREQLNREQLAGWVADPERASRRPLYLLLLGLCGTPTDAQNIEQQLMSADLQPGRGDLAALAAAALELGGPARLDWIEAQWLQNETRSSQALQQVLTALSVHGEEGGRIPRQEIIQTYLRFLDRRPRLGGLVAQDLATWGVWEATPRYAEAILLDGVSIASRVAMAQYLRMSPHPQARSALRRALERR